MVCPNFGFQKQLREYEKELGEGAGLPVPLMWQADFGRGRLLADEERQKKLRDLEEIWGVSASSNEPVSKEAYEAAKKQLLGARKGAALKSKQQDAYYANLLDVSGAR